MRTIGKCPLILLVLVLLAGFMVASLLLPDQPYSDLENRPLAAMPAFSLEDVLSGAFMKKADDYVNDQLPLRDSLMMLGALKDAALLKTERNGILHGRNGRLFEQADTLRPGAASANLAAMNKLATATGLPVSLLMIPLPWQVYREDLPALYTPSDATALVRAIREDAGQVAWIDPLDALLQAKGSEPLYYRTDHHLTAAGADVVYRALADAWGLRPQQPDSLLESPGFYGSFYARAPTPLIKPDTLTFSLYNGIQVLIDGNDTGGLYDEVLLKGRSKYAALLHNNPPRLTLINPEGEGVLLVLRDSYASAMLPAIARHFARVEAIDPRYYSDDLPALCAEQKVERILCIYGLNALTNDRNLPRLAASFSGSQR